MPVRLGTAGAGLPAEGPRVSTAFRKYRDYPVISTGAMRSIAQRRNLFKQSNSIFLIVVPFMKGGTIELVLVMGLSGAIAKAAGRAAKLNVGGCMV